MRHLYKGRKLGRTTAHREALLRNLVTSFSTKSGSGRRSAKAKETRPLAEKMITLGKKRHAACPASGPRFLTKESAATKLFDNDRPALHRTARRLYPDLKLGPRQGDGAEMAMIELVGSELKKKEKKKKDKGKKSAKA